MKFFFRSYFQLLVSVVFLAARISYIGKILLHILRMIGKHPHAFFVIDYGTICCFSVCVCFTCDVTFTKRHIVHATFMLFSVVKHAESG